MKLSLIVAMSNNRVIGRDGQLPWRLSADLMRFKQLTMGHAIIMGRRTFESIGRLLPGRTSIVVTRKTNYDAAGALIANDLDAAIRLAGQDTEAFIIGGAGVYQQSLPRIDRIYLTRVDAEIKGDTFLPEWQADQWELVREEHHHADPRNDYPHTFQILDRRLIP